MVAVAVLWVWIIIINSLGEDWSGNLGNSWVGIRSGDLGNADGWVSSWVAGVISSRVSNGDGVSDGHDGSENCELK